MLYTWNHMHVAFSSEAQVFNYKRPVNKNKLFHPFGLNPYTSISFHSVFAPLKQTLTISSGTTM